MSSNQVPCETTDECNSVAVSDAMAHVTRIYIAGLLILGLFGNAYCVTAFLMPDYRRIPSSLYLSALALSDIGFLLTLGFIWLQSIGLRFLDMSRLCTTCMFLSYFCCFVSGWLVLAVTAERYFLSTGMGNPNVARDKSYCPWELACWKRKNFDRRSSYSSNRHHRRVRLTFASIIAVGILANSWVLFAADSVSVVLSDENETVSSSDHPAHTPLICDVSQAAAGRLYPIFNTLDMIFSFTLPFLGVLILNVKIGFRVCKAQDLARRNALDGAEEGVQIQNPSSIGTPRRMPGFSNISIGPSNGETEFIRQMVARHPELLMEETQLIDGPSSESGLTVPSVTTAPRRRTASRSRTIELRVTKLLVTVSMAYLILNLPSYLHRIVFAFEHPTSSSESSLDAFLFKSPTEIIAETLAYLMFYTQFAINFFLYSCHGCMFGFVC